MPQQQPYGDIFQVGTPYIDRASQQIREDEKNRRLEKQKRDDALDNEFKTILPGVRSADTSKLADLWGDYKTSWIELQKNPPKKQAEYLQKQKDLLVKKAAVYQWVNGSKDFAERKEKPMASEIVKDKTGTFVDQAHEYMMQGLRLPFDQQLEVTGKDGQKSKIDWTDPDALKRHIDTKSVFDAIKYATGKDEKYSGDKYKEKPTDLQYVQPEITVKNNPVDFYSAMSQASVKNQVDFLNTLPHPTEAEYFETQKKYNEIDPKIKKMWRMTDGRDLPNDDNLSDLERAIKFQAMTYALNPNNQPQVKVKPVNDLTSIAGRREQFQKDQQARYIAAGFTRQQRGFYHQDSKNEEEQKSTNIYIDGLIDDSVNHSTAPAKVLPDGSTVKEVPFIPIVSQSFKVDGNTPISYRVLTGKSGTRVFTPIYKKYVPSADGKYLVPTNEIDEKLSKPMSESEFKTTMGYKMLSKKQQSEYGNQNYSDQSKTKKTNTPTNSLNASERRKK